MPRKPFLLLFLVMLGSLLTACGETTATPTNLTGKPQRGGTIVTAIQADAKTIHPYKCSLAIEFEYSGYLYKAHLTKRNPKTLEVIGLAAKSWQISPSDNTVTFTLRDDLTWSDGKPITSADYLWTWQQATDKANKWSFRDTFLYDPQQPRPGTIMEYVALDAKTLRVKLFGLTFNSVESADIIEPLPRHIWENKDWNDPVANPEIDHPTVVSGPWLLKEWVRDRNFTLVRNDKSTVWSAPYLDSVVYTVVPNTTINFEKLKNQEIDFYRPSEQDFLAMQKLPYIASYKMAQGDISLDYIGFNFRRPYLQDRTLRQALNYALDKKTLLDTIIYNLGEPLYSTVPTTSPLYNPNVEKYEFDLAKAKKLLADAGYTLKDGKLYNPKGEPLPKLKFRHNQPNPSREKTAAFIQQAWKELGLEIEILTSDLSTMNKFLTNEPFDYDFWIGNWSVGLNSEDFGNIWKNIPLTNRGNWVNEEVNRLYSDAVKELDFEKRKQLMFKIQERESQELPYIFYYQRLSYIGVNQRIKGVQPTLLDVDWNLLTDWYVS
jgi:peptide/nickel transport system substrate-binding protein